MYLKKLELNGFKSFAHKTEFLFDVPIIAIVGPNGSGKSNVVEAIRFVLGEQSVKSMRGKTGADLIFKGSRKIPKMSRASVQIVFDNRDRVFHLQHQMNEKLNIDFDEVVIGREVFADGGNKYTINGHEVRMKDIHELIASVNIGASGHHIISQGEADRYLNANIKDRRELIEEALGLKVYHYRIKESLRKLEKAEAHMRESELLRREIAPHLKFLKRQVDKIEKSKKMREDLMKLYQGYFSQEEYLTERLLQKFKEQERDIEEQLSELQAFFKEHGDSEQTRVFEEETLIKEKQEKIKEVQKHIAHNLHELGRVEGMINLLKKQEEDNKERPLDEKHPGFSYQQVKDFFQKIIELLHRINAGNIQRIVADITSEFDTFINIEGKKEVVAIDHSSEIETLEERKHSLTSENLHYEHEIKTLEEEIFALREEVVQKQVRERQAQKQYYEHKAKEKELLLKGELLDTQMKELQDRMFHRDDELKEAQALLGNEVLNYQKTLIEHEQDITEAQQEQLKRDIERIKIRLEDMGGGSGADVIKEYEETRERDQFLAKEIDDIKETIQSLQGIIADLKKTLNEQFEVGLEKINKQFNRFFGLMFGGGSARLELTLIKKRRKKKIEEGEQLELLDDEEEQEKEYGIDIHVQLPRKKVSDLDMLSGGERSLTSIALLFALSQVNPPPFLILDETDAALDEANSQKYGDMIESLSEFSQLIVVTHNRETMSRAQTLFGVTLGRDDASRMLSLRLEDATKYAK